MALPNTIRVNLKSPYRHKEGIAAAGSALKPGMMIIETIAAEDPNPPTVNIHATAGGFAEGEIVIEDYLQGLGTDGTYTPANIVFSCVPQPGDRVLVLLADAVTTTIDAGLTSNGDGTFKVATSTDIRVFKAKEVKTASGVTLCLAEKV